MSIKYPSKICNNPVTNNQKAAQCDNGYIMDTLSHFIMGTLSHTQLWVHKNAIK